MAVLKYALEPNGPKILKVSWEGISRNNFTISYNDSIIGIVKNPADLQNGCDFTLPDETIISVKLSGIPRELQILRNGTPLPGTSSDPKEQIKNAVQLIYLLAGINLIAGLIAEIFNIDFLKNIGVGYGSILLGLIYLILAFFTSRGSLAALYVTFSIYLIDTLFSIFYSITVMKQSPIGQLFVRYMFIYYMWKGIKAMTELKKNKNVSKL